MVCQRLRLRQPHQRPKASMEAVREGGEEYAFDVVEPVTLACSSSSGQVSVFAFLYQ